MVEPSATRRRIDVEEDAEYALEEAQRAWQAFLLARITRPSEVSPRRLLHKLIGEMRGDDDD